ncbi:DUF4262 domain-containing protein [Nocardia sp. alder85J]|uniref:DUF4262 domain-containing protein n=1 Tax=Nocardia sp. alder85J TaxID=2862949 RepID=UPI001CD31795|nr:DUF4262 domain-containing protein [Nocardia sp. alder85J]MCX4094527.1 DUF4262 domain-containing protein [Nocardia sp. alder85J]
MCWLCDHPDHNFDDYLDGLHAILSDHDYFIQGVTGDPETAGCAYTVGLTRRDRPELVVTGLRHPRAAAVLDHAARLPATATTPGARITISGIVYESLTVVDPTARLLVAEAVFGPDIAAVQLAHPDRYGLWPWDRRYTGTQPLLGLPAY